MLFARLTLSDRASAGIYEDRSGPAIEAFFAPFQIHRPDESDADLSIDLLKSCRLSHGVGWPDCLIAATALRSSLTVVTTNVKHFSVIPTLQVVRPY